MTKKILIIFIVILLITIALLLGYNWAMRKARLGQEEPMELTPTRPPISAEIAPKVLPKIMALTNEPVIGATLFADGKKVIYFLKENGKIYQTSFDGIETEEVSGNVISGLIDVLWSPKKDQAINIFKDKKYLYDFSTDRAILYNRNIQEITWSPDGSKVAYLYQQGDESVISIAEPDSTGYQDIFQTRMKDLVLDWTGEKISLKTAPSGLASTNLYALNPKTKKLNKVIGDIYGLEVKWSLDGKKLLYQATTSKGKQLNLFLMNADGSGLKNLDLATLVEKCAWSENNLLIYCAVPSLISSSMIMPDDWYKGVFTSQDIFFKIDPETGNKIKIAEGDYDATNLFVSPNGDKLFFINKNDGLLYVINL